MSTRSDAGTSVSILGDPLSEVTRGERKTLLLVSAIGIVMERTGLIPTKITTFGIEFSEADRTLLLRLFALVVAYFLVAFVVYGSADALAWIRDVRELSFARIARKLEERRNELEATQAGLAFEPMDSASQADRLRELRRVKEQLREIEDVRREGIGGVLTGPVALSRMAFEFIFPIAVAVIAIVLLVF
jgi:hypothetical protein